MHACGFTNIVLWFVDYWFNNKEQKKEDWRKVLGY
jgi:hypothetical protein